MTYTIYNTADYWQKRALEWKKLSIHSPFVEPIIQEAWWKTHQHPGLQIIEVEDDGEFVGIVPLCSFDDGKTLQFLGNQDVSDYLDWLCKPRKVEAVGKALRQYLHQNLVWQKLKLFSIPQYSSIFTYFNDAKKEQQDVCPIIQLSTSWEEYLLSLPKKHRHEIQRKWKRLEESGDVTFRVEQKVSRDSTDLKSFFRLHKSSSSEKANFWTDQHCAYFTELTEAASQAGWLRLYFLDIVGQPAATMYCFEYQGKMLVYNSGFDADQFLKLSPGQVLTSFTIKDAIERGLKVYDFLRGEEEYKFRYGAQPEPVYNLTLTREQFTSLPTSSQPSSR